MKTNPRFVTAVLISLTLMTACQQESKSRSKPADVPPKETPAPGTTPTNGDGKGTGQGTDAGSTPNATAGRPETTPNQTTDINLDKNSKNPGQATDPNKAAGDVSEVLRAEADVEEKTQKFLALTKALRLPNRIRLSDLQGYPVESARKKASWKDCLMAHVRFYESPMNELKKDVSNLTLCSGKTVSFESAGPQFFASHRTYFNQLFSRPDKSEQTGKDMVRQDIEILTGPKSEIMGYKKMAQNLESYETLTRAYLSGPFRRMATEKILTEIKTGATTIQTQIVELDGKYKYTSTVKSNGSNFVEARYHLNFVTNEKEKLSVDYQSAIVNEKSECLIRVLQDQKVVFENLVPSCFSHLSSLK